MKTYIVQTDSSKTGYALVVIDDNGNETVKPINSHYPGEKTLILPENPSNRKYFSPDKVDKAGGKIELTYKESKTFGPRTGEAAPRQSIEDFMTDDEKAVYNEILEKARQRREEARKPKKLTDVEKAQRALEKAKAAYEAILKAQAAADEAND